MVKVVTGVENVLVTVKVVELVKGMVLVCVWVPVVVTVVTGMLNVEFPVMVVDVWSEVKVENPVENPVDVPVFVTTVVGKMVPVEFAVVIV